MQGINCLDTAEYYQNYDHIREGLRYKPDAVVITKCHAYDRAGALDSVDKALSGLGRKYLDCMMLHEQESRWTLKGHEEALNTFAELKDKGSFTLYRRIYSFCGLCTGCIYSSRD